MGGFKEGAYAMVLWNNKDSFMDRENVTFFAVYKCNIEATRLVEVSTLDA